MKLILMLLSLISSPNAQADEDIPPPPPCFESHLLGRWVGPNTEMEFKDDCTMETGEKYDDHKLIEGQYSAVKIGEKKCQIFEKKNFLNVSCNGSEDESFHRYKEVVHK